MSYEVLWTRQSQKDMRKMDKPTINRIVDAIYLLARENQGDVVRLQGVHNEYRLRVGEWRVRFTVQQDIRILSVLRVLPRGEAYKRM